MGHFCQAADEIFMAHNSKYKLKDHCYFGSKYNVPVGFLSLRKKLKFASSQKLFEWGG